MILEKETFNKYGYYIENLSYGSKRLVIWQCDKCKTKKIKEFRLGNTLCQSCSNKSRSLNRVNNCIDCSKQIVTLSAKRCNKCQGKFKRIILDKFCIDCGRKICKKSIGRCLKCSNASRRNPVLPHKCIECDNLVRVASAKRCRTCANRLIAKTCEHKPTHGKHTMYKDTCFDSTWEANFAKWLDLSGIKWIFEPKGFELIVNKKKTKYYPDFYIPEFDCYIEIKGYWREDAKAKFEVFKKYYSNINIKVFNESMLQSISVIK